MTFDFLVTKEQTLALPQSLSMFCICVLALMAKGSGILPLVSLLTKVSGAVPACPLCPHLEELQGTEKTNCSPLSTVSRELQTSLLLPSVRLQGSDKPACFSCPSGGMQVFSLGYRHACPSPPPSGKAMPGKPIFLPAQITRGAAGCSSLLLLDTNTHLQEHNSPYTGLHPKAGAPSQQRSGWDRHAMFCSVSCTDSNYLQTHTKF